MRYFRILISALMFSLIAGVASAQYVLGPQVFSNGATVCSNGSYDLQGTLSQSAIRLTKNGSYELQQGYWRFLRQYYPCCIGRRGNVNGSEDERIDLSDQAFLSAYLTNGTPVPPCMDEANVNGSGPVDISDLSYLIYYLMGGTPPPACP